MMVIIILIQLLFPGDVALWFPDSLLPWPRRRQMSCTGCFAMVCGKEQQNVIRRKQELEEKGNLKTHTRIPFQWYAEQGALLEIK